MDVDVDLLGDAGGTVAEEAGDIFEAQTGRRSAGSSSSAATVDLFHLIGLHPVAAGDERTVEYVKILASFRFT